MYLAITYKEDACVVYSQEDETLSRRGDTTLLGLYRFPQPTRSSAILQHIFPTSKFLPQIVRRKAHRITQPLLMVWHFVKKQQNEKRNAITMYSWMQRHATKRREERRKDSLSRACKNRHLGPYLCMKEDWISRSSRLERKSRLRVVAFFHRFFFQFHFEVNLKNSPQDK